MNDTIERILSAHPQSGHVDPERQAVLLRTLAECDITCTTCADACLSEPHVQMLARCVALNQDCADTCATTARTLARIGFRHEGLVRHQLEACREACRSCAEECDRHEHMEHCMVCAEMCRQAEQACAQALEQMTVMA